MLERPVPATKNATKNPAAPQRRYRQRQRNGEVMVTVGFSPYETAILHRLRCLDLDKLEDRAAIADAIHLLLAHILDV